MNLRNSYLRSETGRIYIPAEVIPIVKGTKVDVTTKAIETEQQAA